MKKVKLFGKKFFFSIAFSVLLVGIVFSILPKVWAEPVVTEVQPGAGTLKAAVMNAKKGDTLKLKAGSYTGGADKTVTIDKELTILGEGGLYSKTIIEVPIVVKTSEKVKIANFTSSSQNVEPNFVFIKTVGKVNLEVENAYIWGIFRGTTFPIHNAMFLEVTKDEDVTSSDTKASGDERSLITIKNSLFVKPSIYRGISLEASNTTINLEKTEMTGRTAVAFVDGKYNVLNAKEDTNIEGISPHYRDNEVVTIQNQQDLTIHLNHSKIVGSTPTGNGPTKVISFREEGAKSTNVKIELENDSQIIDEDVEGRLSPTSYALYYRSDGTASDKNIVTMDKTSGIYLSIVDGAYREKERILLPLERKYNQVNDAAVIGIYDSEGNGTVQLYDHDSKINELTQNKYIQKEGFNFKGWFKTFDGNEYRDEYEKVGGNYPLAVRKTNMDLYAKFAEILYITVKNAFENKGTYLDGLYQVEKGQTISESDDSANIKSALARAKVKEGQEFRGFIIYNSHGNLTYEPDKETELTDTLRMTEDCTIEAVHQVKVTINGKDFYIDAGQTLNDIKDKDGTEYQNAKMSGSDGRDFSRFVKKGTDITVTEEEGIPSNTELVSKYFYTVTVDGKTYPLEENLSLSSSHEIQEALESITPQVAGRTFSRYVDKSDRETAIDLDEYKISKNLDLEAIYTITVQFIAKEKQKTYTLDVGQSLSSLKKNEEIISALESVASNIEEGKEFDGFVLSYENEDMEPIFFDETSDVSKEALEQQILEQELQYNTTIYVRSNLLITINGVVFQLEAGDSLKTAILEKNDATLKEKYNKAKYQDKEERRFYKFVDKEGKEVTEDESFEKSKVLTSKYLVFVTLEDKDSQVIGTYPLEEGTSIENLLSPEGKTALDNLRNDIVSLPEGPQEDLHFEKLTTHDNQDVPSEINEDITIKGLYHYDVTVVRDYDNPQYDVHGVKGLKVYRGEALKTIESDLKEALEELKTSVNQNKKRQLHSYIEENTQQEFTDVDTILNKVYNTHLYINAKVAYQVKIGEVEDFIVEGGTLKESQKLLEALETLKNNKDKEVKTIVVNGNSYGKDEITGDTVITEPTEISATYQVKVSIDGVDFFLEEGGKLADLEEQTTIDNQLSSLEQQIVKGGYHFKGYFIEGQEGVFNEESIKEVSFEKNATIKAKYNIQVTIKGALYTKNFQIESNDTLEEVKAFNENDYNDMKKKENRKFLYFVTEDENQTILKEGDTAYHFTKNTTLVACFAVTVKIDKKDYFLKEGQPLSSQNDILEALEKLEKKDKTLVAYQTDNGLSISKEDVQNKKDVGINENITILPKYMITVEIEGKDSFQTTVDENTKLKDIGYQKPERFRRFVDAATKETVDEEEELTKNTKLQVIYGINVTLNGHTYELDTFQTFADLKKLPGVQDDLKALEENLPEGKVAFSRFVSQSLSSNEVEVKDETVFEEDTTILPKYKIAITVVYQEEEEQKELMEFELEEGSAIRDLASEELEELTDKLEELEKDFSQKENKDVKFLKFVTEEGADIDIQTTKFNEAATITAIFEVKEEVVPTPNPDDEDYPYKEPAPNTGIKEEVTSHSSPFETLAFLGLSLSGGLYIQRKRKQN